MEEIPAIYIPGETLSVFLKGKQFTIYASDSKFESAVKAFTENNQEELYLVLNPAQVFKSLYAKYEQVEVKDGNVYVSGDPISNIIAERILQFLAQGVDCLPVFKFITKLNLNPSSRAVNELYTFLEHKFLPLTGSGNFLAYKALRSDFTDVHTGKFDNSVGNVLEMPRNKVDDNKEVGCSYGFHAGTLEYARGFRPCSGKLVLVEINPADVVSIPTDCECQKLRTCKYKVVAEYEVPLEDLSYESRYSTDDDEDVDREWDDDSDDEGCCNCSECDCCSIDCDECNCCNDCCDCGDFHSGVCMAEPEEQKTEIQLELNLDNKMTSNWADARFQYLVMLPWLYAHRRPALGNALKDFYKDVDDLHNVNPIFGILKQFTSDEDAYKIYKEYTNS
jgi:hypothetical protein